MRSSGLLILVAYLVVRSLSIVSTDAETRNKIPDLFFELNSNHLEFKRGWFSIKSRQVTRVLQQKVSIGAEDPASNNEWLVEEHFSPIRGLSYSVHTNVATKDTYTLLAHSGRTYYSTVDRLTKAKSCKLDHRLDYSTMFPWRHTSARAAKQQLQPEAAELKRDPIVVLGVGALWLNAIERVASCAVVGHQLDCNLDDANHKVQLKLTFPLNDDGTSPQLKSARVSRMQAIHLGAQTSIMQDIVVDVQVESVLTLNQLDEDLSSRIDNLLNICRLSTSSLDTLFPNLMRSIAESDGRSYYLSYLVKAYGFARDPTRLTGHYNVQEWFSYELEQQTVARRDRLIEGDKGQKHYAQFRYRQRAPGLIDRQACFKVVHQTQQCSLTNQIEDPLEGLSRLSERKIDLVSRATNSSGASQRNSASLIGLGALFMNAADMQHKRELANDSTKKNKLLANVEWLVEDHEAGLRIHFYFRKRDYAEHNQDCQVDDLVLIEFRKLVETGSSIVEVEHNDQSALGGLDSDQRPVARYSDYLVLSVELLQFSTSFYKDELDEAFKLPKICNEALKQVHSIEQDYEASTPANIDTSTDRNWSPAYDQNKVDDLQEGYEFPEIEQYLSFERDYIINSVWKFDNGTISKLAEYLMLEDNQEREDRQLFSRLDVSRSSESEKFSHYKMYLRYATNTALQVDQTGCNQVFNRLEELLELLSIDPVKYYGLDLDEELNANKHQFKVYGIGALWKLASQSHFIQYSGSSEELEADRKVRYIEWRLVDEPDLAKVKAVFKFRVESANDAKPLKRRMTLVEVRLDVSAIDAFKPVDSIKVSNIELKTGEASSLHFILPPTCDPNLENQYLAPIPKFPTFIETFHDRPSRATFSLNYYLVLSFEETSSNLQMMEVNKGPVGLGQVAVYGGGHNLIFWILTNSGRTLMQHSSTGSLCKEFQGGLSQFFNLHLSEQLISGGNEDIISESSNFLIANLWHLLGKRIEFESNLNTTITANGSQVFAKRRYVKGKLNQHHRFIEWALSNGEHGFIEFQFEHLHANNKLSLYSVRLVSPELQMRFMIDHISHLATFETEEKAGLPGECRNELSVKASDNFPRLSAFLESEGSSSDDDDIQRVKMRSSQTSNRLFFDSSSINERDGYILIDEYLTRRGRANGSSSRYRLRSNNLQQNFDYLIFEETEEFFDLSIENLCSNEPVVPHSQEEAPGGMQVDWIGENLLATGSGGMALYGPLNLWRLAELGAKTKRNEINLNQINVTSLLTEPELISNWFLIEHWQVEAKFLNGISFNYKMRFNQELDDSSKQWHIVLENIEVEDALGHRGLVEVDVLDYGHSNAPRDRPDELSIPRGFGCKRNELFKLKLEAQASDLFVIESLSPTAFDYEARLELIDQSSGHYKSQPVLISGWFGRCPKFWNLAPIGPLRVISQRRHFLDGTKTAMRQIITSNRGQTINGSLVDQVRLLDEQTGSCSLGTQVRIRNELFRLDFSYGPVKQEIVVTDATLGLLTSKVSDFELIQLQEDSQLTRAVYEFRHDKFELTPQLIGPTSVIRTFERKPNSKSYANYYYHSDVDLEALVLGRARLTLSIKNLAFTECPNILQRAAAEDCHQSSGFEVLAHQSAPFHRPPARLRNFIMRFSIDTDINFSDDEFEMQRPRIDVSFTETLMKLSAVNLRSMQLGQVHSSLHTRGQARLDIRFNLMEPPSSIEWFIETPSKYIGEGLAGFSAATKLLNSKYSCSNWCDSLNCIALSYCPIKRSCQVVTSNIIRLRKDELVSDENRLKFLEDKLRDDVTCSYYYAPTGRMRDDTLDKTVSLIKKQVDDLQEGSGIEFAFRIGPGASNRVQFEAIEFEELTGGVDLFTEQQEDDSEIVEDSHQAVFATVKTDSLIKFEDLKQIPSIETKLIQTESRADCQTSCQRCQLFSYCNQVCVVVSKLSNWLSFKRVLDSAASGDKGCAIQSKDYVLDYHEFPDTSAPASFAGREDDLSLIECAAMCSLQTDNSSSGCLSFDYCTKPNGQATCYLQDLHVMMDDFDESILANPSVKGAEVETAERCSHYSKSLLSDFDRLQGKKFAEHRSIVFKGPQLDSCALICRRDDACLAFEHCYFSDDSVPNFCYIHRSPEESQDIRQTDELEQTTDLRFVAQAECSIYTLRRVEEEFRISEKSERKIEVFEPNLSKDQVESTNMLQWLINAVVSVGCLFMAMVVGAIVQIMYIVVTGKRIPLFYIT